MLRLKKSNVIRRVKSAHFIGRQLSRLKLGQSYYTIAVSTVSAISLISLAFEITFWMLIIFFPILLLGTFIIGYFMDIYNITNNQEGINVEWSHMSNNWDYQQTNRVLNPRRFFLGARFRF